MDMTTEEIIKKKSAVSFAVGVATGMGVASMLAPKSGKDMRTALKNKAHMAKDEIKEKAHAMRHKADKEVESLQATIADASSRLAELQEKNMREE